MKKRVCAVFTAVLLGVTALPSSAFAAESYQEAEKAAFSEIVTDFVSSYADSLNNYEASLAGSYGDFTITLGDAGRGLLGMMLPVDISWLDNLKLSTDVSIKDGQMGEVLNVSLNGTDICSVELYSDFKTGDVLTRIPELSESYLKASMQDMVQDTLTEEDVSASISADDLMNYMNLYENILEYLPSADALENLLDTYGTILIEGMTEGETGSETLAVSEISQECTTFEGVLNNADATATLETILSQAREDENIREILTGLEGIGTGTEDLYQQFQDGVDSLSADLAESVEDDGSALVSKIWVDDTDKIVGRQLSLLTADGASDPLFTYQTPSNGDERGFLMELGSEESTISLTGSGTVNNGIMDGSYSFLIDSQPTLSIELSDYDTETAAEGKINGVYTISFLPSAIADASAAEGASSDIVSSSVLAGFSLAVTLSSGETDFSATADILSAGESLLSLSFSADQGEGTEIPDFTAISENAYDTLNQEDSAAYAEEVSLDTILSNLMDAGMPETFIEDLITAFTYTEEDSSTYEDEYSSDYAEEELEEYDTYDDSSSMEES